MNRVYKSDRFTTLYRERDEMTRSRIITDRDLEMTDIELEF